MKWHIPQRLYLITSCISFSILLAQKEVKKSITQPSSHHDTLSINMGQSDHELNPLQQQVKTYLSSLELFGILMTVMEKLLI